MITFMQRFKLAPRLYVAFGILILLSMALATDGFIGMREARLNLDKVVKFAGQYR